MLSACHTNKYSTTGTTPDSDLMSTLPEHCCAGDNRASIQSKSVEVRQLKFSLVAKSFQIGSFGCLRPCGHNVERAAHHWQQRRRGLASFSRWLGGRLCTGFMTLWPRGNFGTRLCPRLPLLAAAAPAPRHQSLAKADWLGPGLGLGVGSGVQGLRV